MKISLFLNHIAGGQVDPVVTLDAALKAVSLQSSPEIQSVTILSATRVHSDHSSVPVVNLMMAHMPFASDGSPEYQKIAASQAQPGFVAQCAIQDGICILAL